MLDKNDRIGWNRQKGNSNTTTFYNEGIQKDISECRIRQQMDCNSKIPRHLDKSKQLKLQFCKYHKSSTTELWKNVIWFDSRFLQLHGRSRILHKQHERMECYKSKVQVGIVFVIFSWLSLELLVPIKDRLKVSDYLGIVTDRLLLSSSGHFKHDTNQK